ncbi:MAG: hypothetical protein IT428_13170 [Planctomycetaceae bacterium]|nr:hypothetical protein [Planctomycetaceae bacterium]
MAMLAEHVDPPAPLGGSDAKVEKPNARRWVQIVEVWKQPREAKFRKGDTAPQTDDVPVLKPGERCLFLGSWDEQLSVVTWHSPIKGSADYFDYLRGFPAKDRAPRDTIAYAFPFLNSQDAQVASDAWDDFADEILNEPRSAKGIASVKWIREQWKVKDVPWNRTGALGVLLGLEGNEGDAELLRGRIVEQSDELSFRQEMAGVMLGYLLLSGEKGLSFLETTKLSGSIDVPYSETYFALQAIRALWNQFETRFEKERLRSAVRLLLDRPELADFVIIDLIRWKDWSLHERLMTMLDDPDFASPAVKRNIVRYFLASIHEGNSRVKAGEPFPAHAAVSREMLKTLRQRAPDLVSKVEKYFPN